MPGGRFDEPTGENLFCRRVDKHLVDPATISPNDRAGPMRRTIVSRHGSAYTEHPRKTPIIGDGMGNNTKQMALLAAGYLLGEPRLKTVLLVAGESRMVDYGPTR